MQVQFSKKDKALFLKYFDSKQRLQMIRYFRKASDKMQFFVRNIQLPRVLSKIQLSFKQNNLCFDFTEHFNILFEVQYQHIQVDLTSAHWKKHGTPAKIKYKIQQEAFQIYSFPLPFTLNQTCIACRKDEQSRIDFLWIEKEEDEYEAINQKDTIQLGNFLFDTKFIRNNHQLHQFLVSTPSRYTLFRNIRILYLSHLDDQQAYTFDLTKQRIIIKCFYQDLVILNLPISHQFQVIQLRLPVFQNLKTLTIESNRIEIVQFLQQKSITYLRVQCQNLNASFLRSLRKVLNENVYYKFQSIFQQQGESIIKDPCEMKYLTQIHKMNNTYLNMNKLMIEKQQLIKIPTLVEEHFPQIVNNQICQKIQKNNQNLRYYKDNKIVYIATIKQKCST